LQGSTNFDETMPAKRWDLSQISVSISRSCGPRQLWQR